MAEASLTQNALSLRSLFAMFLDFNHPEDALGLWTAHHNAMMEDKVYHAHRNGHGTSDPEEMERSIVGRGMHLESAKSIFARFWLGEPADTTDIL